MKLKKRPGGGHSLLNNGFTLIELLAVIVILAIIALIATPIVLRIIDNSKTSAVVRSAELYMDSVEQAIMRENLKDEFSPSTCTIQNNGNLLCDDTELEIEVSGEKPTGGTITLEDGKVTGVQDMLLGGYVLETDSKGNIVIKGTSKEEEKKDELVNNNTYVDSVLNGADPELYNNLTAVTYDGENWVVADPSTKWYDYSKQEWANAVILKDGVTKEVGEAVTVDGEVTIDGEDPEEAEALAMFVWIPRYEYTIPEGTEGEKSTCYGTSYEYPYDCYMNPGEIEVNFISKETTTPSSSEYHVHPAFTFGNTELNGIWVGKFRATGTSSNPMILPNDIYIEDSISNYFSMAQKINSLYLKNSKLDSHMIKNSEWGAVAYLSQSRYGKYGNVNFSGAEKEVYGLLASDCSGQSYDRNTEIYYTYDGYTFDLETETKTRELLKGTRASTTGNIYGVYDTSDVNGGEVVMGVLFDTSTNKPYYSYSGFTDETFPTDSKYYDKYTTEDVTTACNGNICYGHALSETSGWYGDTPYFVSSRSPWLSRGGYWQFFDEYGIFSGYGKQNTSTHSIHIILSAS